MISCQLFRWFHRAKYLLAQVAALYALALTVLNRFTLSISAIVLSTFAAYILLPAYLTPLQAPKRTTPSTPMKEPAMTPETKPLVRFTTVNGAHVAITTAPDSDREIWTCDCGADGGWYTDGNKVRAEANEHARTCLVEAPEATR